MVPFAPMTTALLPLSTPKAGLCALSRPRQSHTHTVRADSLAPGHAADADYPANPSSPLLRSLLRRKSLAP